MDDGSVNRNITMNKQYIFRRNYVRISNRH